MKKQLLLTSLLFFGAILSYGQWGSDVRLTNNTAMSSTTAYSNARCIVASGDTVHVVWRDNRDGGNYEIYYKRSTDGGLNWGADTRISNNIYMSSNPCVSVSGASVHVVWEDLRDGNYEIYYNHSTNGGATWETDLRLTIDPAASQNPCVSVSGAAVYVVWNDNRDGGQTEVYYKRSTDGGTTWSADARLTLDPAGSWNPAISASGSMIHVVWTDGRGVHPDIYYKHSSNGGLTWGSDIPLTTNTTNYSDSPSLAVSGLAVHVAWRDSRDGNNYEIYYKHSTDGGINWGSDTRISFDPLTYSWDPSIAVYGSNVHVVWNDSRDGNYEIYYRGSADGGLGWGGETRLTNNPAVSFYPFIAASGPALHVVWQDIRDGNYEIYYKRSSGIPGNRDLTNIIIGSGTTNCYNATQTINVAGSGTTFTIQTGGSTTMIAGQTILFLPTTIIQPGSYLWGYIAPSGPWCLTPSLPSMVAVADEKTGDKIQSPFKIFPNPTTGNFTLEILDHHQKDNVIVDIYGMWGEKLSSSIISGEYRHDFFLTGKTTGIYLISVVSGVEVETIKIMKQ